MRDGDGTAFGRELVGRLPLAGAVLELFDFAFDDALLAGIYESHRGRCYEDVLRFPVLLRLVRDALLAHGGSAHRLFLELERDGAEPADESNFYRKLARMPVAVGRALLRTCTPRLRDVAPPPASDLLPGCFEAFDVVAVDGKKVKGAAARLRPTRGYRGALPGAKALVALDVRSGLAVAMSDALDGEANDLPLVKDLLPQLREAYPDRPVLLLADRQFGNAHTLGQLSGPDGRDRFVVRLGKRLRFEATQRRVRPDGEGRETIDEAGVLGSGKGAMPVRRVTLVRGPGSEDVVLVTDLTDRDAYPAEDLLKLYRRRWGIEQVFGQVTQTFALEHLIGCHPRAVLFQFALCLLMYNLVQVLKGHVAADGRVDLSTVSTHGLFYDVRRELQAWAYLGAAASPWDRAGRDAAAMRRRLGELLAGSWDPVAYAKASDRKPRKPKPPPKRLHGGHTSVQRLLDGTARVKQ